MNLFCLLLFSFFYVFFQVVSDFFINPFSFHFRNHPHRGNNQAAIYSASRPEIFCSPLDKPEELFRKIKSTPHFKRRMPVSHYIVIYKTGAVSRFVFFHRRSLLSGVKYALNNRRTSSVLSYTSTGSIRFLRNSFCFSSSASSSCHGLLPSPSYPE